MTARKKFYITQARNRNTTLHHTVPHIFWPYSNMKQVSTNLISQLINITTFGSVYVIAKYTLNNHHWLWPSNQENSNMYIPLSASYWHITVNLIRIISRKWKLNRLYVCVRRSPCETNGQVDRWHGRRTVVVCLVIIFLLFSPFKINLKPRSPSPVDMQSVPISTPDTQQNKLLTI